MLTLSLLAVLLGSVAGCDRSSPQQADAENKPDTAPLKVTAVKPERKTVRRTIKRPGYNIEAFQSTPLYARISGYVRKWNFDIGDSVAKGAVMAELDVPEMEVDVQQKEAEIAQAEAEIRLAKSAILHAQAERDRTKSQHVRLAKAGLSGAIDKENVDEARLGHEAAQAMLAKAQADVKVAEAKLKRAQKARDYTKTMLDYAKIRAPFEGEVTQRHVNEGDFVQPGPGKKGEPLFVVNQVDPVRVFVNVPELDAVWIRPGVKASVRSQGLPGQEFKGTVTRTAKSLNPATRTLRTEIDLPNPDRKLLPGMYVDVTVVMERPKVWTLPESAVATQDDEAFCYRLENGKAVRTPLQIGLHGDKLVEVVKKQTKSASSDTVGTWEDFTGEEPIIASGLAGLKDGQVVSVSPEGK